MTHATPDILEAARLPALCRGVCLYAGLPLPPGTAPGQRFVVRSGSTPPEMLAKLLEEGFLEDGVEVRVDAEPSPLDLPVPASTAKVIVQPGHAADAPTDSDLCRAVDPQGGPVLLFSVERYDERGRLLGVTWAAVPEEEPPPEARLRAAVRSHECDLPPEDD